MSKTAAKSACDLMLDSWALAFDAGAVMWLRGIRLMSGGRLAEREAQRMVTEKVVANMTLLPALMLGGLHQSPEASELI